jgi:molybdopterin molybdotransferase
MDMPPFNKSAVDGYACRQDDLGKDLKVLEVIAAGIVPSLSINPGECSKIMTGSMVPDGADTIFMIEDSEPGTEQGTIRFNGTNISANICYKAEDLKKGSMVLKAGTLLRPQEIAVLASAGIAKPVVYRQARIGIIATGDELIEPNDFPGPSEIRNSNAWQLLGQARRAGCIPTYYGIARDNENHTLSLIEKATAGNDIVLMTGGVSVGDFDFVPKVLLQAGFEILFRTLAVQPGKPSIFATRGQTRLFALPGNPVSSFVQFELMVRHLLTQMTGCITPAKAISLPLGFDFKRRRTDRKAFVPVHISEEGTAQSIDYHGSAHIHAYTHADGIITIEIGQKEIAKGSKVNVRLL